MKFKQICAVLSAIVDPFYVVEGDPFYDGSFQFNGESYKTHTDIWRLQDTIKMLGIVHEEIKPDPSENRVDYSLLKLFLPQGNVLFETYMESTSGNTSDYDSLQTVLVIKNISWDEEADINLQDSNGRTLMHYALNASSTQAFCMISDHNPDLSIKSNFGLMAPEEITMVTSLDHQGKVAGFVKSRLLNEPMRVCSSYVEGYMRGAISSLSNVALSQFENQSKKRPSM